MPAPAVITWPAPAGEVASPDYTVEAGGTPLFVYPARVRAEILKNDGLWTHKTNPTGERASFALFDIAAPVKVRVKPARAITTATVLPERAGIVPTVRDGVVEFTLDRPRHLTVLCDGDDRAALHLFAGAPETDVPRPDDPNVLYFGPGVHETHGLTLRSGQTVYLAGGAVLRVILKPGDEGKYNEKWKVTFFNYPVFTLQKVENVTVRGRGIVDTSAIPHPGGNTFRLAGAKQVRIEGVMLRDAANWNFTIANSDDVTVRDVRIISGRLNSDGINSVNSRRVTISDCFVRNHDDSIVVKTPTPGVPAEDITVERNVVWDDWGYALGVSYETRAPIRRVRFRANDIIYARHWCLGIHLSDSATVEDIVFADTTVSDFFGAAVSDESTRRQLTKEPKLIRFDISKDVWGKDEERGRIRDVTVDGVTVYGRVLPASELLGADAEHDIRGVSLKRIRLAGQPPVTAADALRLKQNEFVRDLSISAE